MTQGEIIWLEDLVPANHNYRKFSKIWSFKRVEIILKKRVFSKREKRVRYRGVAKNQFAEFMHAMCFNLRRLVSISPPINRLI